MKNFKLFCDMYVPNHFNETNHGLIVQFLIEIGFGMLVSSSSQSNLPLISHLPFFIISTEPLVLLGHLAKVNPQASQLNGEAVYSVQGPHGYISPSVYEKPDVPTWNFMAVHLTGELSELTDNELNSLISQQMFEAEKNTLKPVHFEALDKAYTGELLNYIKGFKLSVKKIEAQFKLSQNRSKAEQINIVKGLEAGRYSDQSLADFMKRYATSF